MNINDFVRPESSIPDIKIPKDLGDPKGLGLPGERYPDSKDSKEPIDLPGPGKDGKIYEKLSSKNDIPDSFKKIFESGDKIVLYSLSVMPRNGGEWGGMPGNSPWKPDREFEPGDRNGTNPDHKTWGEILDKYGIDSVTFKDGEPDFSEVSKGEVQIDDFSDDRDSNFTQADEKMAEQRGCTPEEVAKWRSENKYTWHECRDCKTMLKVPTEVHGNISHSGGVSEFKKNNKTN